MHFFEDRPAHRPDDDEPPPAMPEWFGPPPDVLGGVLTAYPTGLLLSLLVAVRREELSRERRDAVEAAFWADRGQWPGRPPGRDGGLRLGVELADGRRTETQDRFPPAFDVPREPPVLVEHHGEGSGGSHRLDKRVDLWLWPLPEGDAVSLVLQ